MTHAKHVVTGSVIVAVMMKRWLLGLAVLAVTCGVTQVSLADLVNGGFEAGSLTGWTRVGNGGVQTSVPTVGVKEGSYSGRIEAPTIVQGSSTLSQTLALNAGDTLEGWYSLRNSNRFGTYPAYGRIIESDADIISVWEETIPQQPGVFTPYTKDWTKWSWVAPTSGTYTLQFGITNPSGQYGGVVYLDGMTLTPVPEPVTLSLLALGGLVLIRRSRQA